MSDLDTKIAAIRAGLDGVTPGPWQVLRSDPAEGVNCHWIKAQPSPALRGFLKEVAYVEGTYYAEGPDARDAAHIARLDPDTVRAILDRLDAVTRERDEARARFAALEEALRAIASGQYSGVILTSLPPKDPAVERARAALNGEPSPR